jgi:hypothetical protein
MISGSVGSSYHGQPRATKDIDLVIAPTEEQFQNFIESLGTGYYVSLEDIRDVFTDRSIFNVIDVQTGWKADFILRKDRAFSCQEFERRHRAKIGEVDVWMTSPEDMILSKLEWSEVSSLEQQFQDALGIAVVQWDHLNIGYLRKWARELQLKDILEQLLERAERYVK